MDLAIASTIGTQTELLIFLYLTQFNLPENTPPEPFIFDCVRSLTKQSVFYL